MIDSGVAVWPDGTRYHAFVTSARWHRALRRRSTRRMRQYAKTSNHSFVAPMVSALLELARTGVAHNAIRPTNIFWRIGTANAPQLGECLSAPAGYGQPVLFETVERALSTPTGRGHGHTADDCYAFGVTLALSSLASIPCRA